MIRRAVACSENQYQRLLRVHKKALRSQRSLHSGFWYHGPDNIYLPSWWISFLEMPRIEKGNRPSRASNAATNTVHSNIKSMAFLDFLYPMQTLATIQRFVKKSRTSLKSNPQARNILHRSRAYTSIATDLAEPTQIIDKTRSEVLNATSSDKKVDEAAVSWPSLQNSQALGKIHARFDELLDEGQADLHQEEVWHCFQKLRNLLQMHSPKKIKKLLQYLSKSRTSNNMRRLIDVIDGLPLDQRRGIHYSHAVFAALSQDDLKTALAFHREALSRIQGTVGTSLLLCYLVERKRCKEALEIWNEYWDHMQLYLRQPDKWTRAYSLPFGLLMDLAASMADFAIEAFPDPSTESAVLLRDFALQMIRRVFSAQTDQIDVIKHQQLFKKAMSLKETGLKTYQAAIYQILSVKSTLSGAAVLSYYLRLKEIPEWKPDKALLQAMLPSFVSIRSDSGIQLVHDDYQAHYGQIPLGTIDTMISEASYRGNIELVWSLFHQYRHALKGLVSSRIYYFILNAYCRRGEINNVVQHFQSLQDDYGFIPDLDSWNTVIATHARVGDTEGALVWFDKLVKAGELPNHWSYFFLMSMYAKRGDLEAVIQLLEKSEVAGITPSAAMINSVVLAQIKNGLLDDAYELVEKALDMDMKGSRTRMWNFVINAYAVKHDLAKVADVHRRMREKGVSTDPMTYAALMHGLQKIHPDAAWKILRDILPKVGIRALNIHYSVCLSGFLRSREYGKLLGVYDHMLQQGIKPTFGEQNVLLVAAAKLERGSNRDEESRSEQDRLNLAQTILEKFLSTMDAKDLATDEPMKFLGGNRLDEGYSSAYFTHLISIYGRLNCFDKVAELYDQYLKTAEKFQQRQDVSPPVQMLSALMVANLQAQDHGEVERCWYLALDKAEAMVQHQSADTSKPGWVLHDRRFIMNACLSSYIISLEMQNKVDDVTAAVDDLLRSGYELDNLRWNLYIQVLARNYRGLLAFELCERELIDDWHGWRALGAIKGLRSKLRKKMPRSYELSRRKPSYHTLVYLTKTYVHIRLNGAKALAKVQWLAPRTLDAVRNLPNLKDSIQLEILRGL